ncbi:tetratricopeptide repeat protein [Polaribacter sp. Hel_I_88]|uniref:tetratricopeptide repeat protein n=1 Tax=Polaribacter sp. Hel_I_88 TaxID=1250006 RepID=UPI000479CEA3|nr:tetratricopeptide repeat protein [Polaribacter sp. Hel_I_88]
MKKLILLISFLTILPIFSQENGARGTITDENKKDTIKGTKRALIIGISDYSSSDLTLKYADDDATLFKNYLTKIEKVDEKNITFLINENATSFNILNGLQDLITSTQKNDIVYLFFAGHGDVVDKDNVAEKLGFLLAYDVNQNREFYGTQGVIPFKDISTTVNTIASKDAKITLVLDACRSGYLSADGAQNNLKTFNEYLQNSTKLLSCNPNELSYEGDNLKLSDDNTGHGYFTYYLVLGLMGAADNLVQDNKLQYFELQGFLDTNVNLATNNKQTPIVKSKTSTGIFKEVLSLDKKEALEQVQNPTGIKNILASRSNSNINEKGLELNSDLIKKFNKALENKDYYGNSLSAFEIIEEAINEKKIGVEIINLMKNKLVMALSTKAQLLINDYIGNVENLPNGNVFKQNAKHLEICLELLEKDNFSYNRILTSKLFLEAYAIIKNKQFNQYPLAKNKLNEALKLEKKAAYIYNALGIVLNYEEEYGKSEENYRKANVLIPTWTFPINNIGTNFLEKADYKNASIYYKKVLDIKPNNRNSYNNLGAVSENLGRYQEAENYFYKVKEFGDEYLSITLRNLGKLYKKKGNIKGAEGYFLQAIQKDSTDVEALFDYTDLLIDESIDAQKALGLLKKAIQLEPFLAKGYANYATFLRRFPKNNTDLIKADSLFKIAIKNNPFYTWSYASRGWLFHKQKEDDKALNSFKEGIKINPKKASAYYYLANFYENGLQDKVLAKELFEKSLQIDSFYMPAYKGLVSLLNSENDQETSIKMLQKVINRNSQAPDLYALLGDTFYSIKEYETAIKNYQKAIEVDSTYAKGYTNLAYSKLITKEHADASTYFKLSAKYNPYKNKVADFSKLFLLQARREIRANNVEEATNILEQAYTLDTNIETVFALTELYYFTNEINKKKTLIEELKNFETGKSWQIKKYELLSKIYIDLNDAKNARFYFDEMQKINPIANVILEALVLTINNKNKAAKEKLKTVNPLLLRDKYLQRKFNSKSISIIKKLQE